jgi:hypothetical protein
MTQDQDKSAITGDVAGVAKLLPQAKDIIEANIVMGDVDDDTAVVNVAGLMADIAKALSALSARIAEAEWQPIETAPKTGEEIIARKDRHAAFSCFWYGGRWTHYDIEDGYIAYEPDEWMPFPTSERAARFLEGGRDYG